MDIHITDHGYHRAKERLGLNRGAIRRMVPKILERGVKMEDLKGQVKKYMDEIYKKEGHYNLGIPIIYGDNIFVFANQVLITLWPLPREVKQYRRYFKKKPAA